MNDQEHELIKLAAKAIEIEIIRWNEMLATYETSIGFFNPLLSDGDAFQLMVKLGMSIHIDHTIGRVEVQCKDIIEHIYFGDLLDKLSATRRVITLSAAEIGKGM